MRPTDFQKIQFGKYACVKQIKLVKSKATDGNLTLNGGEQIYRRFQIAFAGRRGDKSAFY